MTPRVVAIERELLASSLSPLTPAWRAAWARIRAAQAAYPVDRALAARLLWQAAQDLRDAAGAA